tara:strand:- start:894 stop:1511 length:618 start_codon:yes stop_codon:yes gene_type:complete
MALTYAQLKTQIQNMTQNTGTAFVANQPNQIKMAENRIYREVKLRDGYNEGTGNLVQGTATITAPTGMLYPRYMKITVSSVDKGLLLKDPSFIREYWPTVATQGEPKYYSVTNATTITLAATPNSTYPYTLGWYGYSTIIGADGATSWLGDNAEDVLVYACMVEAYIYMKGSKDLQDEYEAMYIRSRDSLRLEQELLSKADDYEG